MNNRYDELDSLRGIAALAVFFSHILMIFNETILTKLLFEYGPLRWMVAGTEAVILFFLLSGFVLSLPFYSNKPFTYGSYIIKRTCRIYIPYIITILIALLSMELFYSGPINNLSNWFNVIGSANLSSSTIVEHFFLLGTFSSSINPVVWSLVHELRISLVFPIVMFSMTRMNFNSSIVFALLLSGASTLYVTLLPVTYLGTEVYATIHYSAIFILGALIAKFRDEISKIFKKLSIKFKVIIFTIGILLFVYAHPSFVLNIMINDFNPFYRTVIDSWFTAVGAGVLMVFAMNSIKLSVLLKNRWVNFIGKISYSLYLIHVPVLISCVHLLNDILPTWLIILLVILVTMLIASIMYYLIEKPAIKLGRILIDLVNKRISFSNISRHKTF